ncbi:amino acid adenylation domain-containing protein [Pseudoalteromonas maricaloris]|uniref:non-ribosomal peptide synthetase n=1 Tax=Pseudoalteromonas maricaloris TaxID=184924 RepID=UPI0039F0804F
MTANGKVNVKALPEPDIGLSRAEYVAPKSDTERALCSIWQQVLEVERVGIMDNFFQLGGHSLLATKLVVRINSELNANIQVKDIFALSTVRELSRSLAIGQPGIVQQQLEQGLQEIDKFRHNIENHAVLKQQLPDDCETLFPLSAIQQSMVYFAQTQPEVPIYHDQFPFVLEWVDFDLALFNQAFEYICQAHSILRTSFAVNGFDEPVQFVHRKSQLNIGIEDISDAAPDIQKQQIEDYCRKDLNNKFTFKVNELLWRVKLFSLSSGRVCIILTVQHAILDGWSLNLMVSELLANYARLKDGHRDLIPAPESTYRDYVAINLYRSCSDQTQVFWKDYLQNYNRMKLPFNYAGKPISSSKMMTAVKGEVDASLLRKLQQLTQSKGYTIKEICLAAHVYLLSLITGDSEILTGVVTHNRPEIKDTDRVLGCFLNTIPLRLNAHTSINKHVLITQVRDFLRQVKAHEIFLADIARLAGENDANGNPLFDVIFNFTDFPELMPATESNMLINSEKELFAINGSEMTNTKFDLEVHKNGQHGMAIQIKYSEEYFDAKEVELALNLYLQILELMASSEAQLCSTDLVESVGTKNTQFNETDKAYAYTKTMHALFEEQVVKAPDAIALRHNGKSYSYQELNAKANRISWMLIGKGIQSGDHVGLVMSRSFDMIATLLAILKAGAVYVPMEPDYPEARIQAIEESAQLKLVIFDRPTQAANAHHLYLQEENYATFSIENPGLTKDAGELAYIIYTSGSTGKPKGVRIAHHQAVNLISWVNTEFTVTSSDVMLFITSVTFDLSVYDIFGTLAAGGCIVIVEQSQLHNFEALYEIIITEKITFWDSVPSTLNHLVSDLDERQAELLGHHLRLIFLSGDWIPTMLPSAAKHWFPNSEFISLGGATEGTVWSNFYRVSGKVEHLSSIPYGVPIDNNRFYILDAQQQPVVEGVVGELYIGGVGVAYGYQNDPVKTEQAFFDDPFIETNINGERARMYKTGDLGRILPDGNMELHGRTDHQIKLRGYRIELNEIESVLNLHTGIKEALVNVVELEINGKKNQYLVGYIVSKNNNNLETEVLMSYLSQYLPEYMVPKVFVDLEQLPLSVNGKVDRRALPIPEMGMIDEGYLAPETETEKSLCDLWQETLQVERVGIKDNFFLLGGHSLLATKLIAKMNAGFGVTVPFAILLSEANVQSIAQYIDAVSLNDANLDTLAENENVEEGLF